MEKKNFKKVIEHILHITYEDNNTNIGKIALFSIASHDQKIKLANNIYRETHLENKSIFDKGNISNCIYVLKDGGINLKKDGKVIELNESFPAQCRHAECSQLPAMKPEIIYRYPLKDTKTLELGKVDPNEMSLDFITNLYIFESEKQEGKSLKLVAGYYNSENEFVANDNGLLFQTSSSDFTPNTYTFTLTEDAINNKEKVVVKLSLGTSIDEEYFKAQNESYKKKDLL